MVRGGGRSGPYGRQNASGDQVHVTGLPPNLDENQLRQFFAAYGTVEKCKLLPSKTQGTTTALVRFKHTVEAESMKEKLHGTKPPGSPAEVRVSFSTGNEGENGVGQETSSVGGKGYGKAGGKGKGAGKGHEDDEDFHGGKGSAKDKKGNDAFSIEVLISGYEASGALPASKKSSASSCYVAGLPSDCDDLHLYQLFSPFGPISPKGITVMRNDDKSCKGFAFVNYIYTESAHYAIACYNGCELPDGSWLRVSMKKEKSGEKGKGKGGNKEDDKKAEAAA